MKLKTLASTIILASAALLTSCGSSSDDTTTTTTYFDSLNGISLTVSAESLDSFTYTAQITGISNCYVSTSDATNGTEEGTCTFEMKIKNDTDETAITYSTASATYSYTAASGQLTIGNIYYEIDETSSSISEVYLTISKLSDTIAYVAPNAGAIIGTKVYTMYAQNMYISQ